MTTHSERLSEHLRIAGYSLTTPRKEVFQVLGDGKPHSMHDIVAATESKLDRASAYRTIKLFEQLGIVQRVNIGWKYKLELTDLFGDHHHHISCLKCGKIVAIHEDEQIEHMIHAFSQKYGISAEQHQLEIQGYCTSCQADTDNRMK